LKQVCRGNDEICCNKFLCGQELRISGISMNINRIQDQIIEEFSKLEDGFEKYKHIISLGKSLEPLPAEFKTDEYSISGCQSNVWIKAELKNGKTYFSADSDALITKGIVALLLRVVNNQTPGDILNNELYFIDRIGLTSSLSPVRGNGLYSVLKRINNFAETNL